MNRLKVSKTIKLFIDGKFPRTESGRTTDIFFSDSKKLYAHLCKASRKDLRMSVDAAKAALPGWSSKTAYNRGQILYRMAEMAEAKRQEFLDVLENTMGMSTEDANTQVDQAIDCLVYYAGFTDKYQQVYGAVNPVSGPHHNFTTPEPMGVVAHLASTNLNLPSLVSEIVSVICSGNTVLTVLPENGAAIIAPLSEVIATSDVPGGVVNLLTGSFDELYPHIATHMEIIGVKDQTENDKVSKTLQIEGALNMKRISTQNEENLKDIKNILDFVEFKTVWHPIGV